MLLAAAPAAQTLASHPLNAECNEDWKDITYPRGSQASVDLIPSAPDMTQAPLPDFNGNTLSFAVRGGLEHCAAAC